MFDRFPAHFFPSWVIGAEEAGMTEPYSSPGRDEGIAGPVYALVELSQDRCVKGRHCMHILHCHGINIILPMLPRC